MLSEPESYNNSTFEESPDADWNVTVLPASVPAIGNIEICSSYCPSATLNITEDEIPTSFNKSTASVKVVKSPAAPMV